MKKTLLSAMIVSTLSLIACGGNDSPAKDTSIMPEKSTTTSVATNPADSVNVINSTAPVTINPTMGNQPGVNTQTIPASQAANIATGAGLNPAHGAPGHRCEIAVGAPLNSAPTGAAGAKPQIQTMSSPAAAPVTMPVPASTGASVNGTAKLNPAHGQPGHDCAVQVGAPLKN